MGIPLLRGRFFDERDGPHSSPVVIVNETLARRYWPGDTPIGKRVKGFDPRGEHDDWLTVVGEVKDTRVGGLEKAPFAQIYEVQAQRTSEHIQELVVRTTGNPAGLGNSVRTVLHHLSPGIIVSAVEPMTALLDQQTMQRRFQTWLISLFSALALMLAALGVFAVMHYSVAARTHEIGIRMAVGARGSNIASMLLGNATMLALFGILTGAGIAAWSTQLIAGMLYAVKPSDPTSFAGSAALLLLVALLATYLPARRAARIEPIKALREE